MYLRQPKLPVLQVRTFMSTTGSLVTFWWETPNNLPFPMPIDVVINGKLQRIEVKDGKAGVPGIATVIDPNGWVLKAPMLMP
jgi:hypothetical protein